MPISCVEWIETCKENASICDLAEAVRRIKGESELVVIDVREIVEFEDSAIPGAVNIPRGFLEFKIAEACPSADQPILLHCKSGGRAVLAAKTLAEMGYEKVDVYHGMVEDLLAALE